jgi:hypothetical protein
MEHDYRFVVSLPTGELDVLHLPGQCLHTYEVDL